MNPQSFRYVLINDEWIAIPGAPQWDDQNTMGSGTQETDRGSGVLPPLQQSPARPKNDEPERSCTQRDPVPLAGMPKSSVPSQPKVTRTNFEGNSSNVNSNGIFSHGADSHTVGQIRTGYAFGSDIKIRNQNNDNGVRSGNSSINNKVTQHVPNSFANYSEILTDNLNNNSSGNEGSVMLPSRSANNLPGNKNKPTPPFRGNSSTMDEVKVVPPSKKAKNTAETEGRVTLTGKRRANNLPVIEESVLYPSHRASNVPGKEERVDGILYPSQRPYVSVDKKRVTDRYQRANNVPTNEDDMNQHQRSNYNYELPGEDRIIYPSQRSWNGNKAPIATKRTNNSKDNGPTPKKMKTKADETKEDEKKEDEKKEGRLCPICMEEFNNGAHKAVSLKCGHVFGCSCVKEWLIRKTQRNRICPTCRKKANMNDIRPIYL